jgi:hypothetical protein
VEVDEDKIEVQDLEGEEEELLDDEEDELLDDEEEEEEEEDEELLDEDEDEDEDEDSLFDVLSALFTSEETGENIVEVMSGLRDQMEACNKSLSRIARIMDKKYSQGEGKAY